MPRDASDTRTRLLEEAERLFATRGVYQATVREIIDAAGQRNASALTYHFGSRDGVLSAILTRHGDPLDTEHGHLLLEPIHDMATRDLVGALLLPLATRLTHPEGRNYLRIVDQLAARYQAWRRDALNPPNLLRILTELESRVASAEVPVQRARVVNVIMLMTAAMADRARALEDGAVIELEEETFLANLADMIVAGLVAPPGPALPSPVIGGQRNRS